MRSSDLNFDFEPITVTNGICSGAREAITS
jgi:hypothetical protein